MKSGKLAWSWDDAGRPADVDNDCVIRGMAIALEWTYAQTVDSMRAMAVIGNTLDPRGINAFGRLRLWMNKLGRFSRMKDCRTLNDVPRTGTFVCFVGTDDGSFFGGDRHCTCIVDGVIRDMKDQRLLNRKVNMAWEVGKPGNPPSH